MKHFSMETNVKKRRRQALPRLKEQLILKNVSDFFQDFFIIFVNITAEQNMFLMSRGRASGDSCPQGQVCILCNILVERLSQ